MRRPNAALTRNPRVRSYVRCKRDLGWNRTGEPDPAQPFRQISSRTPGRRRRKPTLLRAYRRFRNEAAGLHAQTLCIHVLMRTGNRYRRGSVTLNADASTVHYLPTDARWIRTRLDHAVSSRMRMRVGRNAQSKKLRAKTI